MDPEVPPHTGSSHHGRSRIIREAYFEGSQYVPMVRESRRMWETLEAEWGQTLIHSTGGLMIGPADGTLIRGTLASARTHGIPHELLGAVDVRSRFPCLQVPDAAVGVLEERAGVLEAELCITALLEGARSAGADLRPGEGVTEWAPDGDRVVVTTKRGKYRARALVLAAGPRLGRLLPDSTVPPPRVERQVVHWVRPSEARADLAVGALPVTLWEHVPDRFFYLVPDMGHGLKAALHHGGQISDPDAVRREVTEPDREAVRHVLQRCLPGAADRIVESSVCLYANTPDSHFLLGPLPHRRQVIVAGGGSGHGFKFAPAVGTVAAALALNEDVPFEISSFDPGRFDPA